MYRSIIDNRPRTLEFDDITYNLVFDPSTVVSVDYCPSCNGRMSNLIPVEPRTLRVLWNHENFTLESVAEKYQSQCLTCGQCYGTSWTNLNIDDFQEVLEHTNPIHIVHSLQLKARKAKIESLYNPDKANFLSGYYPIKPTMRNRQEFMEGFKDLENHLTIEERVQIQNFIIKQKESILEPLQLEPVALGSESTISQELARAGL